MDDFLFRVRYGMLKNDNNQGPAGNYRNGNKHLQKNGNYKVSENHKQKGMAIQPSDVARFLDTYEEHFKRMAAIAELRVKSKEREADALSGIANTLTRLAGINEK